MSDIMFQTHGHIGHVTLNRPKALNALTWHMCVDLDAQLETWAQNDAVKAVIVEGAGDKAFCAGGDIVGLFENDEQTRTENAMKFWYDEYRMNAKIDAYAKPYVALMDGIVMGGGVGVSGHGSHRVVTERTVFAMPECSLGMIPDVGGTYLLSQMPGRGGEYAALTGQRLDAADCLYGGLADYFVPSARIPELVKVMTQTGDVSLIQDFAEDAGPSKLQEQQGEIDACFGQARVADIMATLQDAQSDFAQSAFKHLSAGSPLALRVALGAVREARRSKSLRAALRNEYRFAAISMDHNEFVEGIRAVMIDKDRSPRWKFPTLSDVPQSIIERMYVAAPGGDVTFA